MGDPRTLRSKRLRSALFAATDGLCAVCGEELRAGWHADHEEAWTDTETTNVHEMRATCPTCNLKKGATEVKKLRQHQSDMNDRAGSVIAGTLPRFGHCDGCKREHEFTVKITVAAVTPGGGKTLCAACFAARLLADGIVERVAWVTPRSSLAWQGAEGFHDPEWNPKFSARRADNTPPLVRDAEIGRVCYVTTYQGIAANPDVHRDELRRHRYLLILDEPHHLADEEGRTWVRTIAPLVDAATHVLLMTGTIERHDGSPIPFLQYFPRERDGKKFPHVDVTYTRRDALRERAVLPIDFVYVDGWVKYLDGAVEKSVDISKASDEEASKVIQTFLGQPAYRDELVRRGIESWMSHRAAVYHSRAIVICAYQTMAREIRDYIVDNYGVQVALAISDDADSERTLRQFRKGERGDVLVTVGMAYEGLDVPDCTHLVCLTNTRSTPWLEQAFARVTRVDWKAVGHGIPYERQRARIFVPDDPRMNAVVEAMKAEQAKGIAEQMERGSNGNGSNGGQMPFTIGLDARPGAVGYGTIDDRLAATDAEMVDMLQKDDPALACVPPHALLAAIRKAQWYQEAHAAPPASPAPSSAPPPPDTDAEARYREVIEKRSRARDRAANLTPGTSNKELFRQFRKSREAMGVIELRGVIEFIDRVW